MKELPLSSPSGRLALVLRDVIERRGIKQKALAKQIGISESSFSLILNAKARPRQIIVTRLMQQLNCTPEEQQAIDAVYQEAETVKLPPKPLLQQRPIPGDEMDRFCRCMAVKSMSVDFNQVLEKVLKDVDTVYGHLCHRYPCACVFYLQGPPTICVDCHRNVNSYCDRATAASNKISLGLQGGEAELLSKLKTKFLSRWTDTFVGQSGGDLILIISKNLQLKTNLYEFNN